MRPCLHDFLKVGAPHPHTAALAEALRQRVSSEAATGSLAASAWGDAETIRKAVDDAGFRAVEMEVIESIGHIPSSPDSVRSWVAYQGSRSSFAREIDSCLSVIAQDVSAALQVYRDGDEFVIPAKAHLVQARQNDWHAS